MKLLKSKIVSVRAVNVSVYVCGKWRVPTFTLANRDSLNLALCCLVPCGYDYDLLHYIRVSNFYQGDIRYNTSTYLISFKFWILWQICVKFLYTSLVNALMWSESKTTWRIQKSSGFFFKNMNCNVTVILIRKPKFTQ